MAHFAKIDSDNKVVDIIVVENDVILDADGNESEQVGLDFIASLGLEGRWLQCSYSASIRGYYPGVGWSYDEIDEVFVAPDAPQDGPTDDSVVVNLVLDEETGNWVEVAEGN